MVGVGIHLELQHSVLVRVLGLQRGMRALCLLCSVRRLQLGIDAQLLLRRRRLGGG